VQPEHCSDEIARVDFASDSTTWHRPTGSGVPSSKQVKDPEMWDTPMKRAGTRDSLPLDRQAFVLAE